MSVPVIGQDPWGDDLNAYLGSLEARISALEAQQVIPSLLYNYSNNTGQAPPSGVLRTNATFSTATFLFVSGTTAAGVNVASAMAAINTSFKAFIQDADDADTRQWYRVTAAPHDEGGWYSIGVSRLSGAATAPNNNRPVTLSFTNQV